MILGSLSEGCAATLISILMWTEQPLGAVLGMCGWLPFRQHLAGITDPQTPGDDDNDVFFREEHTDETVDMPAQAVAFLREELDFPIAQPSSSSTFLPFQRTPIFLAHVTKDEKVNIVLGRQARDCLLTLGAKVDCTEYDDLGHWYSEQMLRHLVQFLKEKVCGTERSEIECRGGTGGAGGER